MWRDEEGEIRERREEQKPDKRQRPEVPIYQHWRGLIQACTWRILLLITVYFSSSFAFQTIRVSALLARNINKGYAYIII